MICSDTLKKDKSPAMLPALHLNGVAGIAPGIGMINDRFNCCLHVHQTILPIICFRTKHNHRFSLKSNSEMRSST